MGWLTSWGEGVFVLLGEVKQPVRVLRQQFHAIKVGVRHAELSNEAWVGVNINGDGDGGDDRADQEGKSEEDHAEDLPVEGAGFFWGVGLLVGEFFELVDCGGFLAGGEVVEEGDGGVVGCG